LLCGCTNLWVREVVQCGVGLDAGSQHGVKHSIVPATQGTTHAPHTHTHTHRCDGACLFVPSRLRCSERRLQHVSCTVCQAAAGAELRTFWLGVCFGPHQRKMAHGKPLVRAAASHCSPCYCLLVNHTPLRLHTCPLYRQAEGVAVRVLGKLYVFLISAQHKIHIDCWTMFRTPSVMGEYQGLSANTPQCA
jgi:hypothetical protein